MVADALADRRHADGIGIELELLPIEHRPPTRRVPITAPPPRPSVEGILGPLGHTEPRLTLEPGGQVEVSSRCLPTVDAVLAELDDASADLAERFGRHGVALAAVGQDVWHDVTTVPQQLRAPRYPAMAEYLAARGPAGATMMRHTCALQINLDLGPADEAPHRWEVANLLAPMLTATFATSPSPDGRVRSTRSLAWQALDPTRTGFPPGFVEGSATLEQQVLAAALAADVMLVTRDDEDGPGAVAGRPGWSFGSWLRDGDPGVGWPTADDLRVHLTTLFHEVRARGYLELRCVDSVPHRWRAVPAVLTVGGLLDPSARTRIHDVLDARRHQLPELLRRAAVTAVSDPVICALAVEVWSFALEGARRLPGISPRHLAAAERFLDRYTLRGRCPADELHDLLARSPDAALTWASEPVPSAVRSRP